MKLLCTVFVIIFSLNAHSKELLNNVLIISIDALHPDAVTIENSPNIMKLAKNGILKLNGQSTAPPKTLISHSAMFTGLTPQKGGRSDNSFRKGDPTVSGDTIMHMAKRLGYGRAYFYSKGKMAFLNSDAVDKSALSREDSISNAIEYMENPKGRFIFLHVSALDFTGPVYGWMSQEYLEDFKFIDEELKELFDKVISEGKYFIIVTSDHAGHEKKHGCDHPEDYKLPFVAASDILSVDSEIIDRFETYELIDYLKDVNIF